MGLPVSGHEAKRQEMSQQLKGCNLSMKIGLKESPMAKVMQKNDYWFTVLGLTYTKLEFRNSIYIINFYFLYEKCSGKSHEELLF